MVAGTSTGEIITGILVAPDPKINHRPLYSADDVIKFYREHVPSIFTEICYKVIFCPKFHGTYLHEIVNKTLNGSQRQPQMLSVISSFDIKLPQPTIFSSFKSFREGVRSEEGVAKLRDTKPLLLVHKPSPCIGHFSSVPVVTNGVVIPSAAAVVI